MFVLDASVALSWCFKDEKAPSAERILGTLADETVIVPPLWPWEVSNALLVAERRKRLTASETNDVLGLLKTLPIRIDEVLSDSVTGDALRIARSQGLTVYDAAYLELALRRALPLATLDRRLSSAARAMDVDLV